MNNIIRCRIRVKDLWDGITYSETTCYGIQQDIRTIKVDGRTFIAGRKNGFGKTGTSIIERINGNACKVCIDHIENI